MRLTSLLLLASLCLAGCGLSGPEPEPASSTGSDAHVVVPDQTAPEDLETAPSADGAADVAVSYALAQSTWSADTYLDQYRQMIALSTGELRRSLERDRPESDQLEGIREYRQTSRGKIIAVDGRAVEAQDGNVIVVVEQHAGARGELQPTSQHVIYRANVRKTGGAWRVASFETVGAGAQ